MRFLQRILLTLAVAGAVHQAAAFSLLGLLDPAFQTADIGYNPLNTDIGGPMNLAEGYRWNIRPIYYGFDPSFMHYFGAKGSNAVVEALKTFNALPPMSKVKNRLSRYPTDTLRMNYRAASLGILDLKSYTLSVMTEELGLASPERYVWTLRNKTVIGDTTFYTVIRRNFDPVTQVPTSYVNDRLYYYAIQDPIPITGSSSFADAVELPVDPQQSFTSVVTPLDSIWASVIPGSFFTGLTRDDVGGLRYLYERKFANSYMENLVTNAVVSPIGSSGGAWQPVVIGTNGVTDTNNFIITALRPGVDKIVFKPAPNTVFGNFIAFTNQNNDIYYDQAGRRRKQRYRRTMIQPDVIFAAGDLGVDAAGFPLLLGRSQNFVNNAALNTSVPSGPTAGPGTITPTLVITFSKIGPYVQNSTPNFLDQQRAFPGLVWGSYDGTTNDPIVYPVGSTIQDLEQIIFTP